MADLFLDVLNLSLSAGYLVLAVAFLRLLLKKAPKWVSPLLWGIVALRLIFPFSIESVLSLMPSPRPIPNDIVYAREPAIDTGIPVINNAVNPIITETFAPAPAASANPLQILLEMGGWLWAMGVTVMLLYTLFSYLRLHRRVRRAWPVERNIYRSRAVDTPFVLGLFRPRIYLPMSLGEEAAVYIVAHEEAHLRRLDHFWKPLGFLLLAIHWFNPLMWLAYILLCRDIELACDERVTKALDRRDRADYSQALLSCSVSRRSIAACPLAFGEVGVKQRVRSVLSYKKPGFWIIAMALLACAVTAVCFLTDPPSDDGFLTVNDVYRLARKGENLSWEDLEGFEYNEDPDPDLPDLYVRNYPMKGDLYLQVVSPDRKAFSAYLSCSVEDSAHIDIQKSDIEPFIAVHSKKLKGGQTNHWGISLSVNSVTETGAALGFTCNPLPQDVYASFVDLGLEQKLGGQWVKVKPLEGRHLDGNKFQTVLPDTWLNESWQDVYGILPDGEYRLAKMIRISYDGTPWENFTVYGEFTLEASQLMNAFSNAIVASLGSHKAEFETGVLQWQTELADSEELSFYGTALCRSYTGAHGTPGMVREVTSECIVTFDIDTMECLGIWTPGDSEAFDEAKEEYFPGQEPDTYGFEHHREELNTICDLRAAAYFASSQVSPDAISDAIVANLGKQKAEFETGAMEILDREETEKYLLLYGVALCQSYHQGDTAPVMVRNLMKECFMTFDRETMQCIEFKIQDDIAPFVSDVDESFPGNQPDLPSYRTLKEKLGAICDERAAAFFAADHGVTISVDGAVDKGASVTYHVPDSAATYSSDDLYILQRRVGLDSWEDLLLFGGDNGSREEFPIADETHIKINWAGEIGTLPDGFYRLGKQICATGEDGSQDFYMVYAEFTLGDPTPAEVVNNTGLPTWGVSITATEVTPEHLLLHYALTENAAHREFYPVAGGTTIQRKAGDSWENLDMGYGPADYVEDRIDFDWYMEDPRHGMFMSWENIGPLPDGVYRLGREIATSQDLDTAQRFTVYAEFTVSTEGWVGGMVPLAQLPKNYHPEDAQIDGCVVMSEGLVRSGGEEIFNAFKNAAYTGEEAFVRFVTSFLGDGGYTVYVHDLSFDGEKYTLRWLEDGEEQVKQYDHLVSGLRDDRHTGDNGVNYTEMFVLTNDRSLNADALIPENRGIQNGVDVDHEVVCSIRTMIPGTPPDMPESIVRAELQLDGEIFAELEEGENLAKLWEMFKNAQVSSEPKTHNIGMGLNLLCTAPDGKTVTIELCSISDMCRINGTYIWYGAADEEDYIEKLWAYFGLDQWPDEVYEKAPYSYEKRRP